MAKFNIERIENIINLTRQLAVGLRDLSFTDNFVNSEHTLTIPATSELKVRHSLNVTPTRYIITSQTGNGLITKGTTEWDDNFAYFYNNGATSVTITVNILK